jgi:hypothetical protein
VPTGFRPEIVKQFETAWYRRGVSEVAVGDRVWLILPTNPRRSRASLERRDGIVVSVDDLSTPGVRIALDRRTNGVDECYASHREVHRAT